MHPSFKVQSNLKYAKYIAQKEVLLYDPKREEPIASRWKLEKPHSPLQ